MSLDIPSWAPSGHQNNKLHIILALGEENKIVRACFSNLIYQNAMVLHNIGNTHLLGKWVQVAKLGHLFSKMHITLVV